MEMGRETYIEVDAKHKSGIVINEYNGKTSLCSASESKKDGKIYMQWMYPQRERQPVEKAIPWKIEIGTKDEAILTLQRLIRRLESPQEPADEEKPAAEVNQTVTAQDSIPF